MLPRPCRDDFEDKGRQIFISIIWLKIKHTRSPSTAYNIVSLLFSPITAYIICLMSCSSEACYFLTAYAFMLLCLLPWIHFLRAIKWLLWSLWSWFHLIIRLTVSLDTWQTCMCVVLCSVCPDSVSFLGPSVAAYGCMNRRAAGRGRRRPILAIHDRWPVLLMALLAPAAQV